MKILLALVPIIASSRSYAQPSSPSPRFEVAAIKSGAVARSRVNVFIDSGRVNYRAHSLKQLIVRAYGVRPEQVVGPDWTDAMLYDVVAILPPDTSKETIPLMLQTLLVERFALQFHRSVKPLTTWVLEIGPGGPKFKSALEGNQLKGYVGESSGRIFGQASFGELAHYLSRMIGQPVADGTGTKVAFEIDLKWQAAPGAVPDRIGSDMSQNNGETQNGAPQIPEAPNPYLIGALRNAGLKLEHKRMPIELVVIDHAEQNPTPN